jgi:light-regulated signal transduction histidine kinase (bacteriophytochrome)
LEHFTHIASHDLREPLRQISNFAQLFESTQKNLDAESISYLQAISRGAMRMQRLLDMLREYSRLDKDGDIPLENEDLNDIVKSVEEDLVDEIKRTGAQISVGELPELPVVRGQIALVFQNLIGNSLKYRQDGVVPNIRIEAARKDYEWVFSVSDNGIGFEPQYNEKIFIMFERLHGGDKYPGDGMGLAICRKVVEKHGGRIWADSKLGKGATFYFTLPVDLEMAKLAAKETP